MHGTYHHLSSKHLPRYLAEFSYRFNRRFSLSEMFPRLAFVALRTPPMPYRVLKLAKNYLITYEAQLPAAGPRWQGFRRLRDDLSGWIDRRFALSNDPPTPIGHSVRGGAGDCA